MRGSKPRLRSTAQRDQHAGLYRGVIHLGHGMPAGDCPRPAPVTSDSPQPERPTTRGGRNSTWPAAASTKHLHHPVVGDLVLEWNTLTCTADPEQQTIVPQPHR